MRASIVSAVLLIVASAALAQESESQSASRSAVLYESSTAEGANPGTQEESPDTTAESVPHRSNEDEIVVTDGLHNLRWVVGQWRFQQPAIDGQNEMSGTVTARVGPGGHSLIVDTTVATGPQKGTSIHEVIVPAAGDRGWVVYTFASNSAAADVGEAYFDGRSLTWRRELDVDGKRVSTEVTFERQTTRRALLTLEAVTTGRRSADTIRILLTKRS